MKALLAAAAAAALVLAPLALADGDPASDYLIAQSTFLPLNTEFHKSRADELTSLLAASKKAGFPLKVAVIASKYDLGAVPILYRQPQQYARFLGQELFYWYKHELLVVMPNGYGLYSHGPVPAADRAAIASLPAPNTRNGDALVDAGVLGVRTLAAKHGISLAGVRPASSGSSTTRDRVKIALGVVLAALAGFAVFARRRWGRR
jgi:hypothetical protein